MLIENSTENKLKLYQAVIWEKDQNSKGQSISFHAESLEDATSKLKAENGEDIIYIMKKMQINQGRNIMCNKAHTKLVKFVCAKAAHTWAGQKAASHLPQR